MVSPRSRQELLVQAQAGDELALRQLLVGSHDRLASFVGSRARVTGLPLQEVDDILQQTYARAFSALDRLELRSEAAFVAWLKTIANNEIISYFRVRQRRNTKVASAQTSSGARASLQSSWTGNVLERITSSVTSPTQRARRKESVAALHVVLASLPTLHRQAVLFRYQEGLAVPEVAARLKVSAGAVRGLLQRAIEKMRAAMADPAL